MANMDKTVNDPASGILWEPQSVKELLTFAGAGTVSALTLLARDTSTLKWVPYVKGGATNGNGVASGVLVGEVTATGAGDINTDIFIKGSFRLSKLVIHADRAALDPSVNIDGAVKQLLRDYGILVLPVLSSSQLDN